MESCFSYSTLRNHYIHDFFYKQLRNLVKSFKKLVRQTAACPKCQYSGPVLGGRGSGAVSAQLLFRLKN